MVGLLVTGGIVLVLLVLFLTFVPLGLWISSMAAGVRVSVFNLIGMRLRRVVPARIIMPLIKATKAGISISSNQLEAHYLAGGNVDGVVDALIASERAGIELPFEKAAAIDLAGRDVLEAVKMSVNPKVIETPNISAVAKDGIELLVKARVTVRTNLERLVGGAGESTILARIGEGIVTTVGSSTSHKQVLENPDDISKLVLSKGLDSGTAFEILSIDIADIDVGRNIGAHLQSLQAEADKNIAQAKAEERRAMAVAKEQEMRAYVVDEKYITGDASDREKFQKWAETLEMAIGNPLYHWSHLELQRYFGYTGILNGDTAEEVWNLCNAKLQEDSMSVRNLIKQSNVKLICTTDDPVDSLEWHKVLAEDKTFDVKVLPAWRPDKAMNLEKPEYLDYLKTLSDVSGIEVKSFATLIDALKNRMEFFASMGCSVSDHALEYVMYKPYTDAEIEAIFAKRLSGEQAFCCFCQYC